MNVFYDDSGKIVEVQPAASTSYECAPTTIPAGTMWMYLDDSKYADVQANPSKYVIQNGLPVVYVPTPDSVLLANAQQAKIAQITASFNNSLLNGFSSSADGTSRTYAIDPISMGKWTGILTNINSGAITTNITVKDINDNKVPLSPAQFKQMAADGFNFYNNQENHQWGLEDQVKAATTVDAVNAIANW